MDQTGLIQHYRSLVNLDNIQKENAVAILRFPDILDNPLWRSNMKTILLQQSNSSIHSPYKDVQSRLIPNVKPSDPRLPPNTRTPNQPKNPFLTPPPSLNVQKSSVQPQSLPPPPIIGGTSVDDMKKFPKYKQQQQDKQ